MDEIRHSVPINTFIFVGMKYSSAQPAERKIVELSFLAFDKSDMLECAGDQLPRVMHKLNLCFNPARIVHPTQIVDSHCGNEMLQNEIEFNRNSSGLVTTFVQHLKPPVCLVADEGLDIVFPLLKKELNVFNRTLNNVYCTDTRRIFPDEVFALEEFHRRYCANPTGDLSMAVNVAMSLAEIAFATRDRFIPKAEAALVDFYSIPLNRD